jgi:uncharacterized protein HemX
MSDIPSTPSSAALASPVAPAAPLSSVASAWWRSRTWALVVLILALAGALGCVLLWQKLSHIQEELARRSTDTGTQAVEARTLARQAQEGSRELSARLAVAENRISEVSLQRGQLEELMQRLSRSRDDNLVVELEANLRLAQQQAQLIGSAEPLLAALKSAEQRLARAAQPHLTPVHRCPGDAVKARRTGASGRWLARRQRCAARGDASRCRFDSASVRARALAFGVGLCAIFIVNANANYFGCGRRHHAQWFCPIF